MKSKNLEFLAKVVLGTLITVVAGCANIDTNSNLPPEEAVRLRAQSWADELMAGNLEGAWTLTSPSYRQFSSWQQYSTLVQGSSNWTSATVDSVKCAEADVCAVSVMVAYEVKALKISNRRPLDYKWVKIDGNWWLHVPAK